MSATKFAALAPKNEAEFKALWEALTQFVENERDMEGMDELDTARLAAAEKMLERCDAMVALEVASSPEERARLTAVIAGQ